MGYATDQPTTPASFTDKLGRVWTVQLDGLMQRKLKRDFKIDLYSGKTIEQLSALDGEPFVDFVALLCAAEIDERSLDADGFVQGLDGAVLEAARHAFLEAWIVFSPPSKRTAYREAIIAHLQMQEKLTAQAVERIKSPEVQKKLMDAATKRVEAEMNKAIGTASGR